MARKKNRKNNKKKSPQPEVKKEIDPPVEDSPVISETETGEDTNLDLGPDDTNKEEAETSAIAEPLNEEQAEESEEGADIDSKPEDTEFITKAADGVVVPEGNNFASTPPEQIEDIQANSEVKTTEDSPETRPSVDNYNPSQPPDSSDMPDEVNVSMVSTKDAVEQSKGNECALKNKVSNLSDVVATNNDGDSLNLNETNDLTLSPPITGSATSKVDKSLLEEENNEADSLNFNDQLSIDDITNPTANNEHTQISSEPFPSIIQDNGEVMETVAANDSNINTETNGNKKLSVADLENDEDEEFIDDQEIPNSLVNDEPVLSGVDQTADTHVVPGAFGVHTADHTNTTDAPISDSQSSNDNTLDFQQQDVDSQNQQFITANTTQDQPTSPPPLPARTSNHDDMNRMNMEDVPLTDVATATRATSPPILPPRNDHERSPPLPRNPVPPPLSEELKSPEFRKNMEIFNKQTAHHHKHQKLKQRLVSNTPSMPPNPKEPSAADVNLIVNRFRVTSVQIDEVQPSVREDIEAGHNLLKSSFGLLMTHGEDLKESLLNRDLSEEKLNAEEDRELQEVTETDWTFWSRVVNDFGTVANKEPEQLEAQITKGIPRQIRGIIWQLIANSKSREMEDIYETLLTAESPHETSIRRDLKRTNFIPEDRCEELFRVLKVYSVYDPDVGYTQGMAFMTTPVLLNCNTEAEAFGLLVSLMKYYHMREFYLPDMPGLMLMLYQFDRLLEENTPVLANHLAREGIRSSMYATQWFLTIFAYKFPLEFVLKILDIMFFEGIESLLKFAVNLMVKNEDYLVNLKFDQLLTYLKNEMFNVYLKTSTNDNNEGKETIDVGSVHIHKVPSTSSTQIHMDTSHDTDYNAHLFVRDSIENIIMTPISLNRYTAEYDSINQMEKRKETEYDSIKIKNFQLQREKEKLQHDYRVLNEEHITIAKELIQYRLDIETLLDENNDLKDNLDMLKKQLDDEVSKSQVPNPDAELPIDLKQDLERTMKRNTEVMALNALLQDKIKDLENTIKELKIVNKSLDIPSPTPVSHSNGDNSNSNDNNNNTHHEHVRPARTSASPPPRLGEDESSNNNSGTNNTTNGSSMGSSFSQGWSGFKKVFKK